MFDKVKGLYEFQKKARQIQKDLKKALFHSEKKGITVTVNGANEVVDIQFEPEMVSEKKFHDQLVAAINDAFKKAQKYAAGRMKEISGGLGLPGL